MSNAKKYILFCAFTVLVLACKKDRIDNFVYNGGREYFPLIPGATYEYLVDSINYNDFTQRVDSFQYYVQEKYDSFFSDNLNEPAMRVVINVRNDTTEKWSFSKVIYKKNTTQFAEKVEDNRRYLLMSFPIQEEAYWNLNLRSNQSEFMIFYTGLFQNYNIGLFRNISSVSVEREPLKNAIEEVAYKEVYGKNIGLLFALKVDKRIQLGKLKGYNVKYQLLSYQP